MEAQGGSAEADAKDKDKATPWLNANSAGTGAYRIAGWERNAQIQLVRNEHYWGGKLPFERVDHPSHQRRRGAASRGAARRHRCRVQPDPRADRLAQEREGRAPRSAHEPRFRLHGADAGAGIQQGARRQGMPAGDRLCDRLRRHQELDAGRRGPAAGTLSADRRRAARPRRSRARSASATIRPRRRNCSPRAALQTASSSRSPMATPRCRA